MKKSELKLIISDIIDDKLEEFFLNDVNEIIEKTVNLKLKKILIENNKQPIKQRLLNKIEQEKNELDEMNEITFGERNENINKNVANLRSKNNKINNNSQLVNSKVPLNEIDENDIDALAMADYNDDILGID